MYKLFFADVTPYYDKTKFDQGYESICGYRKEKVDKCKNEKDKARSLVAGLLFEEACKEYGLETLIDKLADGEHGKPYFKCDDSEFPGGKRMYFNLSHSEDCVMVGIADSEIGVDIQYMKPIKADIASRCFTEKEMDMYCSASDDEYLKVFYRIWCLKESYVKYTGNGLREGLNTFSVVDHFKDSGVWQEDYIYAVTVEDYKAEQQVVDAPTAKPKTRTELALEEIKDAKKLAATPKPQEVESDASKAVAAPKPTAQTESVTVIDANTPVPKGFESGQNKTRKILVVKPTVPQKVTFVIHKKDSVSKEINVYKNMRFRRKTKMLRMK